MAEYDPQSDSAAQTPSEGPAPDVEAPPRRPPAPRREGREPRAEPVVVAPRKKSWLRKLLLVLLVFSIVLNVYLGMFIFARLGGPFESSVVRKGDLERQVAVFDVVGAIDAEQADDFVRFCAFARSKPEIQAVVFRVNSPGGGVAASDRMHAEVVALRQAGKPVVVSMGGVAASGGYYISAPADEILAEPTTITGSIGVISMWVVVKGTLEKIGMEPVVMKSHDAWKWKDEISPFNKPGPDQREHLQGILDQIQARFEKVVRDGRKSKLVTKDVTYRIAGRGPDGTDLTHTAVEPLNGKVYLGQEAVRWGLVDGVGYERDAIDRAAALAGLKGPQVKRYSPRKTLSEELFGARQPQPLSLSRSLLDELQTPRLLLLWRVE